MTVVAFPKLDHVADPNVAANRDFWEKYIWPDGGDEWSRPWGTPDAMWLTSIYPRLARFMPTGHILEIACGFGRVSNYLRYFADRLTLVDLAPKCIAACKERFAREKHVEYHVNDGRSLEMVADSSVDLAVSWDSLVHTEHETVREYLRQLRRKLRPGGVGFIHHSNLGMQWDQIRDEVEKHTLGGRRPSMTAEKFRKDAAEFGVRVLSQELLPWTEPGLYCDCFSLFMRDEGDPATWPAPRLEVREDWGREVAAGKLIGDLYRPPARIE
ncbi:MAG: class I SAM-dependent methyltransferase [Phycisphaeraceae bacterium]|nr:class I SAM-dependent methyltransferase [Phycisphaeraceae bacterium]